MNNHTMIVKDIGDREATFVASSDSVDRQGDIVDPAGADITHFMKNPQFLLQHDSRAFPIGNVARIWQEGNKLMATVKGLPAGITEEADIAWRLIKEGFLHAVSIGFHPTRSEPRYNDDGGFVGYIFHQWELLELSLVSVPANPDALLVARSMSNSKSTLEFFNTTPEHDNMKKAQTPYIQPRPHNGEYKMTGLLAAITNDKKLGDGAFEREVSEELYISNKTFGDKMKGGSFLVPVLAMMPQSQNKNHSTVLAPANLLPLSQSDRRDELFTITAAALEEHLQLGSLGATISVSDSEKIEWVKQDSKGTAAYFDRDTVIPDTPDLTFSPESETTTSLGCKSKIFRSGDLYAKHPNASQLIADAMWKAVETARMKAVFSEAIIPSAPPAWIPAVPDAPNPLIPLDNTTGQLLVENELALRALLKDPANNTPINYACQPSFTESFKYIDAYAAGAGYSLESGGHVMQGKTTDTFFLEGDGGGNTRMIFGDWSYLNYVLTSPVLGIESNPFAESAWNEGSILLRAVLDEIFFDTSRGERFMKCWVETPVVGTPD
ncbi:MAG: HK97 family phage prohead protease [Sneathiella sp.]|uniref:HK97 family phage prohead protease n=1 Tax=Sneathiella sp. TaxID=1964365 RepID=UPI0030010302